MPLDINSTQDQIQKKINAIKTYKEVVTSANSILATAGNSTTKATSQISSQLDKIRDLQKRFQRNAPTSMDQLLDFIGLTQGNGSVTLKYLRGKILEAAVQIEPKMSKIMKDETIKALGCSVEQTYNGVSSASLEERPLPLRPLGEGIYIPVNSLDFFSNLKQSPQTNFGKV